MSPATGGLAGALDDLAAQGLRRRRRTVAARHGARLAVDGRELLSFAGNDYLGLAAHPALVEAAREAASRWGVGAGASHLICGHFEEHEAAEAELAAFCGAPRALLFSSGYLANLGLLTALAGRGDAVFADRLNHASLNDAAVLSRARLVRYPHLDLARLEAALAASAARGRLVVSDAVFSMDGDRAPLAALRDLARRHGAWLLADDAHGFGLAGPGGAGSGAGLFGPGFACVGTLGKAAGVAGAFVAGEHELIEWLLNRGRPYIYTTGSPPLLAAAIRASLRVMAAEPWRRERLAALVARFRQRLVPARWTLLPSDSPIQPLVTGEGAAALEASRRLAERGYWVPAIRPPTVPRGAARLRVSLSAAHREEEVDGLADALLAVEAEMAP